MEDLSNYLVESGRRSHAIVVRDHGGPLQHAEDGSAADLPTALDSAGQALAADVKSGANGVHLDLGAWVSAGGQLAEGVRHLTDSCEDAANGHALEYEIGVDPQTAEIASPEEVDAQLDEVCRAVPTARAPRFLVVQFGTLVEEDRNVGVLEAPDDAVTRKVEALAAAARRAGVLPKAHNCDYLSPWALRALGRVGVFCNIAPQYAVQQNRIFARMLDLFTSPATKARMIDLVTEAGGWRRWTAEPEPTPARILELGAHYAMGHPQARDCLAELDQAAGKANLPCFEDVTRKALSQLMFQHAATLEGVSGACR